MNIRQMEIFRAIMRAGSVTAAAESLNVSQPAVSAMLRHCEDQLGTRLFFRIGRRLEVDFGIACGPLQDGAIEAESFATRHVVCVVPKDHALASRPSIGLADLAGSRVITYGAHTALGKAIQAALRKTGASPDQQMEVNSTQLALTLADVGAGIALVDLMPGAVQPSNLAARPLLPALLVRSCLVFARGRARSRLTRDFVQHLNGEAAQL